MKNGTIELLAPAGDMERLHMAVLYGADSVYLAGTSFGMRSFAGNFSPEELIRGVLWGMADELHSLYREMPLPAPAHTLVGSGNAVRENPVLRQYLAQQFALPLRSPIHREEAAFGAAVFAAAAAGIYPDTARAQNALVHLT